MIEDAEKKGLITPGKVSCVIKVTYLDSGDSSCRLGPIIVQL